MLLDTLFVEREYIKTSVVLLLVLILFRDARKSVKNNLTI